MRNCARSVLPPDVGISATIAILAGSKSPPSSNAARCVGRSWKMGWWSRRPNDRANSEALEFTLRTDDRREFLQMT